MVGLLKEKFTFFNSLGTTKISRSLKLSVYINVVLLINFPEQFEVCIYSNIREVIKFYTLGDKTFETDFSTINRPLANHLLMYVRISFKIER